MKSFAKRITKDIQQCLESSDYDFRVNKNDANLCYVIFTPVDGLYAGQTHVIEMKLVYGADSEYCYPTCAPLCTFKTPIWHPNIDKFKSGIICVDILKDQWAPYIKLDNIFASITLLLLEPNSSSPQNLEAASMYADMEHTNTDAFAQMVKQNYDENNGLEIVKEYIDM